MNNVQWFVSQSIIAEQNLVRLALAAEKIVDKSAETHDLINDCLVSANLLRQSRNAAEQSVHWIGGESAPLPALFTHEVDSIGGADTTPPANQ